MKEKFTEIFKQGKQEEIIPFLKQLSPKERRDLVSLIKQYEKEINKFIQTGDTYHSVGSPEQHKIIDFASFICMNQKEYGKKYWRMEYGNEKEEYDKILEWYCPEWFSDAINGSLTDAEYPIFNYERIMQWFYKGYIQLTPELLGKCLTCYPYDIEKYPETIETHFWYLCEFPSNSLPFYKEWLPLVLQLVEEGKIDRMRMLRECLLASNRNFNKNVTGWFMDVFAGLQPTETELLELQNELFAGLTSVQSKAVNTILNHLKKIISHPDFKTEEWLSFLPNLVVSEVKSIVKTSLTLVEKIVQKKEIDVEIVGTALSAIFVNKEEAIQSKAAKLFQKYILPTEAIKEILVQYSDYILANIHPLLSEYLEETQNQLEEIQSKSPKLITQESKIGKLNTFEEFMFFLPQAMDNPETYYYDIALTGFIKFGDSVEDTTTLKLLEPVFQKACKIISKWDTQEINILLCNLIINYGLLLSKKYPEELKNIEKLYKKAEKTEAEFIRYREERIIYLEKLTFQDPLLYPYRKIAIHVLENIQSQDQLPLLSTPTHAPCWIDPVILVERIEQYEKENKEPLDLDMQLALQRCALDDTVNALKLVNTNLKGEYKELLSFFLDHSSSPKGNLKHSSWWMTAGITRSPQISFKEFKEFEYSVIPQVFFTGNYSWEVVKTKTYTYYYKDYYDANLAVTIPEYLYKKIKQPLFSEYLITPYLLPEMSFWSFPNNFSSILANIIKRCLSSSVANEVPQQSLILNATRIIYSIKKPLDKMGYLFLGTALLNADKTTRSIASEIWIEQVSFKTMDNKELGHVIGTLEKLEWAPLKRFTDLVQNQMINLSKTHNLALEELVTHILLLIDTPITNLKKLLDIYNEIRIINNSTVSNEMKAKLKTWQDNTTLKKVIKEMVK